MDDVLAHAFEGRLALAKAASEPPAMIDRVPAMAPTSPPETGASMKSTPAAASSSPILAGGGRGDGAHVDSDQPGAAAAGDAAHDLGDVRRIGDHGDHQFIAPGRIGRAAGGFGAGVEQRLHRFGAARPDGDLVAALDEIERHRAPHDAEADKSDLHAVLAFGLSAQSVSGDS
jgi:hypothetical protein